MTMWIKSRIKTDTNQTKDIKHNIHFILEDNFILIELLIEDKQKGKNQDRQQNSSLEPIQSKILQSAKENRRNRTFIQYLN